MVIVSFANSYIEKITKNNAELLPAYAYQICDATIEEVRNEKKYYVRLV